MNKIALTEKGMGIIAAILIMLIVSVIALTLASLLGTNTLSSVNYMQSQQAFFLAESGVQRALWELGKGGGSWTGWLGTNPKTLQSTLTGYGDYDVSVTNPTSDTPEIVATGYIPNRNALDKAVRVVDVIANKTTIFGSYAGFGGGSGGGSTLAVQIKGNGFSDSYDSTKGLYNTIGSDGQLNKGSNGDIGTNADINTTGNGHIYGDAMTGPLGTFSNQSSVSGAISHDTNVTLPAVVVPSSLTSLASGGQIKTSTTINPGDYKYSNIKIASSEVVTIIGPANIYLTDTGNAIQLTSNSKISISSTSTGPVVIYTPGDVSATGQGIQNDTYLPANFQLYGSSSSSQTIDLSGQGDLYGTIYAPTGDLKIGGQGDVFGSFVGDNLTITGSVKGGLHHDQSLANLNTPSFVPITYEPKDWREVY